jgi:hypothetical protein
MLRTTDSYRLSIVEKEPISFRSPTPSALALVNEAREDD